VTVTRVSVHMRPMSNLAPMPSDVAARTGEAIRSLTTRQLADLMSSSELLQKRVLPVCWDTVKTADPALAKALDDLHATASEEDLPRFEALATEHEETMARAVKTPTGRATAGLIICSLLLGATTLMSALAGAPEPNIITVSLISAAMLISGFITGRRIAHRNGNWMFSDAGLAAFSIWDAGIDAAAATALAPRAGTAGLTPDILRALTAVWIGAGLSTDLLVPPVRTVVVELVPPAKTAVKRPPRAPKSATPSPAVKRPAVSRSPGAATASPKARRTVVKHAPGATPVRPFAGAGLDRFPEQKS